MKQTKPMLVFPIILVMYEIAIYLSNDMYLPAIPDMMRSLHLSISQAQWTLTAWFIGSATMPLMVGALAERFGRRQILLTGGMIYIAASAVCALSMHASVLLVTRFIQGAMMATMIVPGYAVIHESYDQKGAVKILALMGSITIMAPALGPLFGSMVLWISDWRGIFWIITALASLSWLLLAKYMPETHHPDKRQKINFRIIFGQYKNIVLNAQFMLVTVILGFIIAGFIVWITGGPLLVIEDFHYQAFSFGWMQALVFGAYVLGNQTTRIALERYKINTIIRAGMLFTLIGGVLAFFSALLFPHTLTPFIISVTLYSYSSALCFAPLSRLVIETSHEPMGVRMATFTIFFNAFAAFGSAISGYFFNGSILSLAWFIMGSILIATILELMRVDKAVNEHR